jgi:gas vesicle protein
MGNSNDSAKLIGAILAGVVIGGALGILFAPCKGSETRSRISSKANDLTSTIKDKFGEFVDKFKKEMETAQDDMQDVAGRERSVIETL